MKWTLTSKPKAHSFVNTTLESSILIKFKGLGKTNQVRLLLTS